MSFSNNSRFSNVTSSSSQIALLDSLRSNTEHELEALLLKKTIQKEELIKKRQDLIDNAKIEKDIILNKINTEVDKYYNKLNELKKQLNDTSEVKLPQKLEHPEIYHQLDQLTALDKSSNYLHVVSYLRTSSEQICLLLKAGNTTTALDIFHFIYEIQTTHIRESQCLALKTYCSSIVAHWTQEFAKGLSRDFEKALEVIGWPSRIVQSTPTEEEKRNFQTCATSIIRLCKMLPQSDNVKGNKASTILVEYKDPILPIQIMVKPLKKRFRFNFFGSNATSKESKPEWYFAQIKSWIRDLVPFLLAQLEAISLRLIKVSSVVEFIRALSELLIIKADVQLSEPDIDTSTFARILEESIIYEDEVGQVLRESVKAQNYIPPFVSTIFSQAEVLKRWLSIEKHACQEKLDEIFSSPTAWNRAVVPGPPEIVHLFLVLLRFVTGRFSHLPQPGHRLQFLQLLVNMIDDFRYRCLQVWQSRSGKVEDIGSDMLFDYVMADALQHIERALEAWEDLPLFESLSFFLENMQEAEAKQRLLGMEAYCEIGFRKSDSTVDQLGEVDETMQEANIGIPNRGLFSEVRDLYSCLSEEILSKWLKSVTADIEESLSNGYTNKKWHVFPEQSSDFTISKEFYIPLQKIAAVCRIVDHGMSSEIAGKWLKSLAVALDDVLMRTLIANRSLSHGAIQQLKHDFIHGLFPVFSIYSIGISMFFTGLSCAIKIWDMSVGDAMLLLDDLTNAEVTGNFQEEILTELEITLTPTEVLRLLATRTDLKLATF